MTEKNFFENGYTICMPPIHRLARLGNPPQKSQLAEHVQIHHQFFTIPGLSVFRIIHTSLERQLAKMRQVAVDLGTYVKNMDVCACDSMPDGIHVWAWQAMPECKDPPEGTPCECGKARWGKGWETV